MTELPAATPETKPLELTVAAAVLLLPQVPVPVASANCVVEPAHTVVVPVMAATEHASPASKSLKLLNPLLGVICVLVAVLAKKGVQSPVEVVYFLTT